MEQQDVNQPQSIDENSQAEKPKLNRKQKIVKEVKSFTFIIFSVLLFRSVLFEPFKIPSGSMIPTLLIGDFILANKFSCGFKIPFSDWFSDPTYLTGPSAPLRGDVVVFKFPQDTTLNYIKRVVGLPGDTIEVVDKVVYVNGKPLDTKEVDGKEIREEMDEKYKRYNFKFFETKTGEHAHITQIDQDNIFGSNFYKVTVPKDHYFVMGDNRDFSADSRSWGFVPFGHIKGRAIAIWFSLSFPWPWGGDEQENFAFRPWRIGKLID